LFLRVDVTPLFKKACPSMYQWRKGLGSPVGLRPRGRFSDSTTGIKGDFDVPLFRKEGQGEI